MVAYRPRVIDALLAERLTSAGAVLIEGPKACGKTFTAEQQAASRVYLDTDEQARAALGVDPTLVLSGDPPQLVDEWQLDATRVWTTFVPRWTVAKAPARTFSPVPLARLTTPAATAALVASHDSGCVR